MPDHKQIKSLCKLIEQIDSTMKTALSGQAGEIAQVPGVPEKVAESVWRFLHEGE